MDIYRLATIVAVAAPLALAQAPAPASQSSTPWAIGPVQVSGLIDGYYNYTPNHRPHRTSCIGISTSKRITSV